jgi:hypothetical protein
VILMGRSLGGVGRDAGKVGVRARVDILSLASAELFRVYI